MGTESPCSRRRHTSSSGVSHCGRGPSCTSLHLVRQGFTLAVQRATIEVVDLAHEPLLLLNRDFGTRQLFDAACRITHIRPRGVMESNEVHSLIALAEAGHGIAVVPSTVRLVSRKIRIMPIVQDGKSLGTWSAVVWDLRRSLPVYGEAFIAELEAYTRRTFPGKQFNAAAPPLPRPRDHENTPTARRR